MTEYMNERISGNCLINGKRVNHRLDECLKDDAVKGEAINK